MAIGSADGATLTGGRVSNDDWAINSCPHHGPGLAVDANGVCTAARAALGAVAPTVLLVQSMADVLVGNKLDDATLAKLDAAAQAAAKPISDKRGTAEFRTHITGVLTERVLKAAIARARGETLAYSPGH